MNFRGLRVTFPAAQRILSFGPPDPPDAPASAPPSTLKLADPPSFQTPIARCSVAPAPGRMTVTLHLVERHPLHAEFLQWLRGVAAQTGWDPRGDTTLRATPGGGFDLRLMFFDKALAWDEDGAETTQLMGARACACICSVSGTWAAASGTTWGLRLDLKALRRVRLGTGPGQWEEPAQAWAFVDDSNIHPPATRPRPPPPPPVTAPPARFMFVDDDAPAAATREKKRKIPEKAAAAFLFVDDDE